MKSETILRNGAFTGFPALFLRGCKPAFALVLIGLPNKKQPRFTVFRQVYRFPAILVTLAIHKRLRRWLLGCVGSSILELERRGVRTFPGCKEAVIENLAINVPKKKEKKEVVELYYDFQKASVNVNHDYLIELMEVYGFPIGVQSLIIEMSLLWRIRLS